MFISRLYDFLFRFLLIFLPFGTFVSVFTSQKLGIPGVTYLKEFALLLMGVVLFWHLLRGKIGFAWTRYDTCIFGYMGVMVVITLFTTGIKGLVYGGRYDFAFLIAFWILYHGRSLLMRPVSYYLRIFLLSGGIALILSGLLKWPLSEDILLYFGYSGNPSNWQFGGSVPIFHGVEGLNVRRFQGIFDGPNTMGAFLLLYLGIFLYYFRYYKNWRFVLGIIVIGFFIAILYTYSRSAFLGFLAGGSILFLSLFHVLYTQYKKYFLIGTISILLMLMSILFLYAPGLLQRAGSSQGHAERMIIGIQRFLETPQGSGLGSAGPAYRHVQDLSGLPRSQIEKIDVTYIPESWYIQQFIEGGIVGGVIFLLLMGFLWLDTRRVHIVLASSFLGILVMNFFLHTFESSLISLSLFLILGLILSDQKNHRTYVKG